MISQRNSPSRSTGARTSTARESGLGAGFEKFMSTILTYLEFNVTKQSAATKY
jgi:hypothetical protein